MNTFPSAAQIQSNAANAQTPEDLRVASAQMCEFIEWWMKIVDPKEQVTQFAKMDDTFIEVLNARRNHGYVVDDLFNAYVECVVNFDQESKEDVTHIPPYVYTRALKSWHEAHPAPLKQNRYGQAAATSSATFTAHPPHSAPSTSSVPVTAPTVPIPSLMHKLSSRQGHEREERPGHGAQSGAPTTQKPQPKPKIPTAGAPMPPVLTSSRTMQLSDAGHPGHKHTNSDRPSTQVACTEGPTNQAPRPARPSTQAQPARPVAHAQQVRPAPLVTSAGPSTRTSTLAGPSQHPPAHALHAVPNQTPSTQRPLDPPAVINHRPAASTIKAKPAVVAPQHPATARQEKEKPPVRYMTATRPNLLPAPTEKDSGDETDTDEEMDAGEKKMQKAVHNEKGRLSKGKGKERATNPKDERSEHEEEHEASKGKKRRSTGKKSKATISDSDMDVDNDGETGTESKVKKPSSKRAKSRAVSRSATTAPPPPTPHSRRHDVPCIRCLDTGNDCYNTPPKGEDGATDVPRRACDACYHGKHRCSFASELPPLLRKINTSRPWFNQTVRYLRCLYSPQVQEAREIASIQDQLEVLKNGVLTIPEHFNTQTQHLAKKIDLVGERVTDLTTEFRDLQQTLGDALRRLDSAADTAIANYEAALRAARGSTQRSPNNGPPDAPEDTPEDPREHEEAPEDPSEREKGLERPSNRVTAEDPFEMEVAEEPEQGGNVSVLAPPDLNYLLDDPTETSDHDEGHEPTLPDAPHVEMEEMAVPNNIEPQVYTEVERGDEETALLEFSTVAPPTPPQQPPTPPPQLQVDTARLQPTQRPASTSPLTDPDQMSDVEEQQEVLRRSTRKRSGDEEDGRSKVAPTPKKVKVLKEAEEAGSKPPGQSKGAGGSKSKSKAPGKKRTRS